ncbi:hypothetical protein BC827DRAFT_77515 [Russula dissimulans]|nr:hypothetical protein BC827DRAFT_77515 [Russula dissimulans]
MKIGYRRVLTIFEDSWRTILRIGLQRTHNVKLWLINGDDFTQLSPVGDGEYARQARNTLPGQIQGHSDDLVLFSNVASETPGTLGASSIILRVMRRSGVGGSLNHDLLFTDTPHPAHPRKGEQNKERCHLIVRPAPTLLSHSVASPGLQVLDPQYLAWPACFLWIRSYRIRVVLIGKIRGLRSVAVPLQKLTSW